MTTAMLGSQNKSAPKPQMGSSDMANDANASIDDLLKKADQGKAVSDQALSDQNLSKRSILRDKKKKGDAEDPESSGGGYNAPRAR